MREKQKILLARNRKAAPCPPVAIQKITLTSSKRSHAEDTQQFGSTISSTSLGHTSWFLHIPTCFPRDDDFNKQHQILYADQEFYVHVSKDGFQPVGKSSATVLNEHLSISFSSCTKWKRSSACNNGNKSDFSKNKFLT